MLLILFHFCNILPFFCVFIVFLYLFVFITMCCGIRNELTGDSPQAYKDLDKEMQEYLDYLVDDLLPIQLEVMDQDAIDTTDPTYQAWATEETISLQEYLTYATRQNWIDISQISPEGDYLDSKEVYLELANYLADYLMTDVSFGKIPESSASTYFFKNC